MALASECVAHPACLCVAGCSRTAVCEGSGFPRDPHVVIDGPGPLSHRARPVAGSDRSGCRRAAPHGTSPRVASRSRRIRRLVVGALAGNAPSGQLSRPDCGAHRIGALRRGRRPSCQLRDCDGRFDRPSVRRAAVPDRHTISGFRSWPSGDWYSSHGMQT